MDMTSDDAMHQHRHEGGEYRRIELITGVVRRRRWTASEKAALVAESLEPGINVSALARRRGVARACYLATRGDAGGGGSRGDVRATAHRGRRFAGGFRFADTRLTLGGIVRLACCGDSGPDRDRARRAAGSLFRPGRRGGLACGACPCRAARVILGVPSRPGLRIMVASRPTDFRKGMDSLAALVTQALRTGPVRWRRFHLSVQTLGPAEIARLGRFRACLVTKRLESGAFTWPPVRDGAVTLNGGAAAAVVHRHGLEHSSARARCRCRANKSPRPRCDAWRNACGGSGPSRRMAADVASVAARAGHPDWDGRRAARRER